MALFQQPDSDDELRKLKSICPGCGEVVDRQLESGTWCETCKPKDDGMKDIRRGNRHQRGYDNTWQRLSKRARKLQPFCEDCGSTDDLTGDHTEEAWRRREAGKVIRLQDIAVVCRRCNSERGAARGEKSSDVWRAGPLKDLDL